jgi:hypothetical protein
LTPKRERAHSIIAPDHMARFCMASICLLTLRAALSPRSAAVKCGDLLFAVCLVRKCPKLQSLEAVHARHDSAAMPDRDALVSPIHLSRSRIKFNG